MKPLSQALLQLPQCRRSVMVFVHILSQGPPASRQDGAPPSGSPDWQARGHPFPPAPPDSVGPPSRKPPRDESGVQVPPPERAPRGPPRTPPVAPARSATNLQADEQASASKEAATRRNAGCERSERDAR